MNRRALPVLLLLLATATGCGADDPAPLVLTSPDVRADGTVPDWAIGTYPGFCDGENRSPRLAWTGVPGRTRSLAVVMGDDAYSHWVVAGIPPTARQLPSSPGGQVTAGTVGTSLAGRGAYLGPCVAGNTYVYRIYALDIEPQAGPDTDRDRLAGLIKGHVLAEAALPTRRG